MHEIHLSEIGKLIRTTGNVYIGPGHGGQLLIEHIAPVVIRIQLPVFSGDIIGDIDRRINRRFTQTRVIVIGSFIFKRSILPRMVKPRRDRRLLYRLIIRNIDPNRPFLSSFRRNHEHAGISLNPVQSLRRSIFQQSNRFDLFCSQIAQNIVTIIRRHHAIDHNQRGLPPILRIRSAADQHTDRFITKHIIVLPYHQVGHKTVHSSTETRNGSGFYRSSFHGTNSSGDCSPPLLNETHVDNLIAFQSVGFQFRIDCFLLCDGHLLIFITEIRKNDILTPIVHCQHIGAFNICRSSVLSRLGINDHSGQRLAKLVRYDTLDGIDG